MASKNTKVDKLVNKRMKTEVIEEDLELQPVAKRTRINSTAKFSIEIKEEPEDDDILEIIDIKPTVLPKIELLDTSCDIIEVKPPKLIKKELKIKISPKHEKPSKIPKKEDPDQENRPFGMLPIRNINDLFDNLSEEYLNDADEVEDDEDCIIVTYRCDLCPKALKSEQSLKDHRKLHNFACQLCNKKFSKDRQLRRHVRFSHENKGRFSCPDCGKKLNNQASLMMHRRDTHAASQPRANQCPLCDYSCDNAKTFRNHQKTHEKKIKAEKKVKIETKFKVEKKPKIEVKEEAKVFEFKAVKKEN